MAMISEAGIADVWARALEHAGMPATAARLYLLPGSPPVTGRSAVWLEPDSEVFGDAEFPLDTAQLRDINSMQHRGLHRIIVYAEVTQAVAASKLRHELEHARQWELGGGKPLFGLMDLVYDLGSCRFGGLPQSGRVYNLVPTERDANAAGASFAREVASPAAIEEELAGPDAVLFREPGATSPRNVASRLLCFAAIWSETFETLVTARNLSLDAVMRVAGSASLALWQELQRDATFAALRRTVTSAEPNATELGSLDEQATTARWQMLAERVRSAERYGMSIAAGHRPEHS